MKILLRSTFVARPEDDSSLIYRNVQALQDSGLGFEVMEDNVIWKYIQDFVSQHHHVPDITTIRGHFKHLREDEIVDRLEALEVIPLRVRGNFLSHLGEKVEDQRTRSVVEILKDAARVVETGITIKEGKVETILKGPQHAIRYVLDRGHDIVMPSTGIRLSGDVVADGENFKSEYDRVESDPLAGIGQFCGITQIDERVRGAKRAELWTHAAFTGGLKSTFMFNWAYNQAIYYRHSSAVFSLEMPYQQVRRLLFALHSYHEKFEAARKRFGIKRCLAYQRIRDGELDHYTDEELKHMKPAELKILLPDAAGVKRVNPLRPEKRFLFEHVVADFDDPKNEYGSIHIEVADPDKSDFTVPDLRRQAEVLYNKDPDIRTIFVDHMGLMSPRKFHRSTTESLNEVLRDLKKLAMNFNRGMGIAIVGLFQISREGFKSAAKNDGRYNLTHLSYANECLVAGTPIPTNRGVVPIETVRPGDRVWSRSGWKRVQENFCNGVRPIWHIETDQGSTVETTGNHLVRVLEGEDFVWKAVQDLRTGDWLVGTSGTYPWIETPPPLPPLGIGKGEKPNGHQGIPITVPTHMTPELAYLLGAWDGDGRVHSKGISYTGNRLEVEVQDRIRDSFSQTFGHPIQLLESPSRPGSFDLTKWSQPLKRWFEDVAGSRGKDVPEVIFRAPRALVLAYLQGLFDTDGWINNQGVIGIKMRLRPYLSQVQTLLSLLGYDTNISRTDTTLDVTGKTYEGWTLRIRGWDSKVRFAEEIGFTDSGKAKRLARHVAHPPRRKRHDQGYPLANLFISLVREKIPYRLTREAGLRRSLWTVMKRSKDSGVVPRDTVRYVLDFMRDNGIDDPRVAVFSRFLDGLHVMRVRDVGPSGVETPVFDVEVEGDHEYQTGPILSHNSERSSDIVTASFVDDDLRVRSLVRFQCLKSRDDQPFDVFLAGVLWACRRVFTTHDVTAEDAQKAGQEIDDLLG